MMAKCMGAVPKVLADDVLIVVTGRHMLRVFANTLNATHSYLQDLGARIAPTKSYNFASCTTAKKWLEDT